MSLRRRLEFVVYSAYGDDSADETRQRVFSVAALFGSEAEWAAFNRKWTERTGGKIFHATDCDTSNGDFKDTPNDENKALYGDLSKLLGGSTLIGAAAAISLPDYKELLGERVAENPYYLCFYSVLGALARDSSVCIPRDSIKFVFDCNREINYNAGQLYHDFINSDEGADQDFKKYMADELGFATSKTTSIQVADLLAREAMKHMDNAFGPVRRLPRLAYQAIRKNKGIRLRLFGRSWCEGLIRFAVATGGTHSIDEYHEWLNGKGLKGDTVARRVKFQAERRGLVSDED